MSRLVLLAVLVLAVLAAADSLWPKGTEPTRPVANNPTAATGAVQRASSGFSADGGLTRERVLRNGQEYLRADEVDAAFPGGVRGDPFDISHLATAADGTLALGVHKLPAKAPAEAAVELWRDGRLISAFPVPAGSFEGGLGFAENGRLVATVLADGYTVRLFTRSGERKGSVSATSW